MFGTGRLPLVKLIATTRTVNAHTNRTIIPSVKFVAVILQGFEGAFLTLERRLSGIIFMGFGVQKASFLMPGTVTR